ncbi:Fructose-2,6-bisphosphatase [Crenothrix polyspora]|uniref:Fructose-2,6-bisphosphatase n=1 Tax=Crenothrix polyspora TaxID=360316 RepID=A0A1R4HEG7_9GAMM|nr:histidine phosphatase family protein [Crenothrix polyspora]SJM94614.1 Fructose-2,6-bisphosphatase [Crenothrix polyspora]
MFENNSSAPKRLFLARHGESVANQQKLISGQLDTPLTGKGKDQAQWLCDVLKNESLSAIYTSSLSRAVETAKPTANYHGIEIQQIDNLKEIHFGLLQGNPVDVLDTPPQALCQNSMKDTQGLAITGGETLTTFERRITDQLELMLQHHRGIALIVAHRNTNEMILSKLLGLTHAVNVKNKYLYEITLGDPPSVNTIRLGGEFHGKKFVGLKDE